MAPFALRLFITLVTASATTLALEVTPGSRCSDYCLASKDGDGFSTKTSLINASDIACRDWDFSNKENGMVFKRCLQCLQTSDRVRGNETDLHWYLYNLRYAISTCLFSVPGPAADGKFSSSCATEQTCLPLKGSLTADDLKVDSNDAFGYCTAGGGSITGAKLPPCVKCLQESKDETYMSNFMLALKAGCDQQPESGSHLGINGTLFATSPIGADDHPSRSQHSSSSSDDTSGLSPSAIAGIVIGVVILFIAALALFVVHFQKQRYFDKTEESRYLFHRYGYTGFSFRPMAQRFGWRGREQSMVSEENDEHLKWAYEPKKLNYSFDPRSSNRGADSVLPTHQAYIPQTVSRSPPEHPAVDIHKPSPPSSTRRPSRPSTPDSFAIRAYIAAAGHPANSSIQPPAPAAQPSTATAESPLPSSVPPPLLNKRRLSSVFLPSIPKLRLPRKYAPPKLFGALRSPVGSKMEMQISRPIMHHDPRFEDRPLPGGPVYATEHEVMIQRQGRPMGYDEVSLRSGKSELYG